MPSAATLSALYAIGSTDPVAIAEATLARIAGADPAIFTVVTRERALREAMAARQRIRGGHALSAIDGVPTAWKDLFDLAGLVTTAGSRVLGPEIAEADAAVVGRLADVGAVTVGRVNMSEFAFSGLGLNPNFGTPQNARRAGRIPGGSSSGSAAAVASGLVPLSIGTDTGGSVRIPAALNGIVGYKATAGRYPMGGVYPLSLTLDSLGVLSATVEDSILADAAMRGVSSAGVPRAALAGVRIFIPTNVVFDTCEPSVVENFEAAIERLGKAGAVVRRATLPAFDTVLALIARHGALVNAEAYALHRERVEGDAAARMDRRVVARVRLGGRTTATDHAALIAGRKAVIQEAAAAIGVDVVAYPTTALVAPPISALEADDDLFVRTNALMLRNTMLGNFLDWCGVSLPAGVDRDGLPTGLLLSGPPGSDERLLGVALAAENVAAG